MEATGTPGDGAEHVATVFDADANHRIKTIYRQTKQIDLNDYLAVGQTGITFALKILRHDPFGLLHQRGGRGSRVGGGVQHGRPYPRNQYGRADHLHGDRGAFQARALSLGAPHRRVSPAPQSDETEMQDRLTVWGTAGYGEGSLTLRPDDLPAMQTDSTAPFSPGNGQLG